MANIKKVPLCHQSIGVDFLLHVPIIHWKKKGTLKNIGQKRTKFRLIGISIWDFHSFNTNCFTFYLNERIFGWKCFVYTKIQFDVFARVAVALKNLYESMLFLELHTYIVSVWTWYCCTTACWTACSRQKKKKSNQPTDAEKHSVSKNSYHKCSIGLVYWWLNYSNAFCFA